MKGKILFLDGLIVVGFLVYGLNQDNVNSLLESAFGVKTVEVDELKQMTERGKIHCELNQSLS